MASQLTLEEREILANLHRMGKMQTQIAERLGRKRRAWEKRGHLPASVRIEGRPAVVDRRSRYGDWEGDTIVGANRRGGAVTLVDRKSGYLLPGKVPNLQAATVRQAAVRRLPRKILLLAQRLMALAV
jgi:IS30 family transposase